MQGCHRSHQCSIPPAARGCRPSRDPRGRPRGLLPSKIPRRRWTRERPASPLLSRRIGPTRESQHRCARNELRWLRGWPGRVSVFPRDGNRATTGRRASAPRSLRDRSRDDDGGGGDWQRWRGSGTDHGAQHHMSRGDEPGGLGRGAPRSGRLGRLGRSDGERRRAGADRAGKTRGCGIVARQRTAHGWPSWNRDCSDAARPNGPPPPFSPSGSPWGDAHLRVSQVCLLCLHRGCTVDARNETDAAPGRWREEEATWKSTKDCLRGTNSLKTNCERRFALSVIFQLFRS